MSSDLSEHIRHLPNGAAEVLRFDVVARKANKSSWPILQGVSIAHVEIAVGAWRAPHRHPNAPELAVIIRGTARAGLVTKENEVLEKDLQEGDCVYFPTDSVHWLRNTGLTPLLTLFHYGHSLPTTEEVDRHST